MKFRNLLLLLSITLLGLTLFSSCGSDNSDPSCESFSSADSVCYCKKYPVDIQCGSLSLTLVSEEKPDLTPHPVNGTIWTKGFAIGNVIYVIDRESTSPHAFWKFNLDEENAEWETQASFPGVKYGLTGSANGKGYASSYASNKFWEYNPSSNQWSPLDDLPFAPGETHWVEYKGKFYVPHHDGIYEFNASTKEWNKFSNQTSSGFGAIYLIGANMYWYSINNDYMSRFNLDSKIYVELNLPEGFGMSIVYNSPFVVLDDYAFIVENTGLWIFDKETQVWDLREDALDLGAYPDDVFVIDKKAYLIEEGILKVFETGD